MQDLDLGAPRKPRIGLSYRAKLLGLTSLAAAAPLAILLASPSGATLLAGLAAAAISIGATAAGAFMLRGLRPLGQAVAACAADAESACDDPQVMTERLGLVAAHMEALRLSSTLIHPVTGLDTREPFQRDLEKQSLAQNRLGVLGVVRFIDFDAVAAFDRSAADAALLAFSERLRASVSAGRPIAHVDRDCFAIWFDGAADTNELQALAYVLSQDLATGGMSFVPRLALGASAHPRDGDTAAILLDCALTSIGEPGQGRTGAPAAYVSTEVLSAARRRFLLSQDLRQALRADQFWLAYQPVVDLSRSRVAGAEALLRWNHPRLGLISPTDFVPMLEESGLMEEVGLWVLNTACREARSWQDQGQTDLTISVNLSPVQCRDQKLSALVRRTLDRHGLKPRHLELELTETAAMEDSVSIRRLLTELREQGVGVAIDDFGSGYSSLTYLKNLPFSKLKIDREFVAHVDSDRDSHAICSALIALSKGLGIQVLAEGAERREEVETLRALGCGLIQGYYFAKPMASADFLTTITDPVWLELLASPVHRQRAHIKSKVQP